jgi:hypothetical protein
MAKFVFVYNDIRKIVKVPKSLYKLWKANNLLVDDDDYDYKSPDGTPFEVTYDWLCQRCYEIAVPLLGLDVEKTWVEFWYMTEEEKKQGVKVCVGVIDI